jgi:hypothetical protein
MLYVTNYKSSAIFLEQEVRGGVGLGRAANTACSVSCRNHLVLAPVIYSTVVGSKIKIYFSRKPDRIKGSLV